MSITAIEAPESSFSTWQEEMKRMRQIRLVQLDLVADLQDRFVKDQKSETLHLLNESVRVLMALYPPEILSPPIVARYDRATLPDLSRCVAKPTAIVTNFPPPMPGRGYMGEGL